MDIKLLIMFSMFLGVHCRRWISLYEEMRCKQAGYLENSEYREKHSRRLGNIRVYECKAHHVSNFLGLNKALFRCSFEPNLGKYVWKTKHVPQGAIYLHDVKCEIKAECSNPPIPENMTRVITTRYQIIGHHRQLPTGLNHFYSGDTIMYSCKNGYALQSDINALMFDDYESDYYSYSYNQSTPVTKNVTQIIKCDPAGYWNGLEDNELYFGECTAIRCDARRFSHMNGGYITDYMESYAFLGEMKLACYDGYRPKNGITSAVCTSSTSYNEIFLPDFGCEVITCMEPAEPMNGYLKLSGLYVGGKVTYGCENGFTLIGNEEWECQADGKWDHKCVVCSSAESYCIPPCIPLGAYLVSVKESRQHGTVLEFACKSGKYFGGTKQRTCMKNKKWSGSPIDCIGDSLFDPDIGKELLAAMKKIKNKRKDQYINDTDSIFSKTINVGSEDGVDLYFLVDVSGSITEYKFNASMRLVAALLPELGIYNGYTGTRLALTYFAIHTFRYFNQHSFASDDERLFKSYEEAQENVMNSINELAEIRKQTELGTAISTALNDLTLDIETKMVMFAKGRPGVRNGQQVLVLISDGLYTTMGDPSEVAKYLKEQLGVEIYSIAVGNPETNKFGFEVMKRIASSIENERHFFEISDYLYSGWYLETVIRLMINQVQDMSCGVTKKHLTRISDNEAMYEHDARRHAWRWMADLRTENSHICGGSLINYRWILTAASCFSSGREISKVHLRKTEQLDQRDDVDIYNIQPKNIFIHEQYSETVKPTRLYDIALIKLEQSIVRNPEVLPVCLWNDKIEEETNTDFMTYFEGEKRYGVVTGWGYSYWTDVFDETLQQMQMEIKPNDECVRKLTDEQKQEVNSTLMFCAGGKEEVHGKVEIIDACGGYSGGPFVVRHPLYENKYIQIGIVSFGFGCKEEEKYGFYTKLTEELRTWIDDTITNEEMKNK